MGYRIDYGGPVPVIINRTDSSIRLRSLVAAGFLMFSLVVRMTWQEGTQILQSVFLPGDLTVTELAFSEMVTDLKDGQPLGDSIVVFCQKILNEAS